MEPDRDFLAKIAIKDRQTILDYANDRPESWSDPDVHTAVVEVLDALSKRSRTRGKDSRGQIPAKRARELKRILTPLLAKAWQNVDPTIIAQDWMLDGVVTIAPFADIDLKRTSDPETMVILGLWFLLIGSGVLVKRCETCRRFYLDASRDQRGRFCRVACRVKSFRGKA